jgi:hypothetical protein
VSPADPQRVRDTVLRAVARRPGIAQAELASRVATATRAPQKAVLEAIRGLEREGLLASSRVERRKVYEIPQASPLELARRAEIERIAETARAAPGRSAPEPAAAAPAPAPVQAPAPAPPPPAVAALPAAPSPAPVPPRSPMPAWGWALLALAGLVWNVLLVRLVAGD